MNTYIVKSGDTLYGISKQFGVSLTDLINVNNVNPNNLQVGTNLIIPNISGSSPSDMFIYTVKKGDSLYNIAKKYSTTVNDIIKLNNLKNTNLSINQKLIIPDSYTNTTNDNLVSFVNYTVKKGDSLYKIATQNNISVDTLKKDNGLSSNLLSIGQNLKIRTTNNEVQECFGEDYNPTNNVNQITYTVKKGDSLYSISKKYNTTVDSIKKKNNLTSNNLSIGQKLII